MNIRKTILLPLLLIGFTIGARAQQVPDNGTRFFASVDIQGGYHLNYNSPDYQIDASLGFKPVDGLIVAAGAGGNVNLGRIRRGTNGKLMFDQNWLSSAPLFIEAMAYIPNRKISPVIGIRVGYQFQFHEKDHGITSLTTVKDKETGKGVPEYVKVSFDEETQKEVRDTAFVRAVTLSPDTFSPKGWFTEASIGVRCKVAEHHVNFAVLGGLTQYGEGIYLRDNYKGGWTFYGHLSDRCLDNEGVEHKLVRSYYWEGNDKTFRPYMKIKATFEF